LKKLQWQEKRQKAKEDLERARRRALLQDEGEDEVPSALSRFVRKS
jgi:hypothetical protein